MVGAAVVVGLLLAQRGLLTRLRDRPAAARFSDVVDSDDQVTLVNRIWTGLFVVTAIVWLVWWAKAHRAATDGRGDLRYGRGWAIGGWFVPFANLVVPKRVADDLWTAAREPRRPRDAGVVRSGPVVAWWATYLTAGALVLTIVGDATTVNEEIAQNAVRIARALLYVVAAVLAFRLVARITDGFEEQAGVVAPARRSTAVRAAVAVGTAAVLVATIVASRVVFDASPHTTARGFVAAGANRRYEPKGEHFSVTVPESWLVMDHDELPPDVAFAATSIGGNTVVTIAEAPAGSAVSNAELRAQLAAQFDVVGEIEQTSVHLPAGDAERSSFTAVADDLRLQAHFYTFRGARFDHIVVVVTPAEGAAENRDVLDTIVRSFRSRPGQPEVSGA